MTLREDVHLKMLAPITVGEATDAIIALFKERVEKAENPNQVMIIGPIPEGSDPTAFTAVERFRQAILKSLEE